MERLKVVVALLVVGALLVPPPLVGRQKPSREPPIEVDFDMNDIPEPKERQTSEFYDFFDATFFQEVKQAFDIPRHARKKAAENVNSVDQVPDSSWFTHRNGRRRMSLEEIRRGPNSGDEPDLSGPWIVTRKGAGITPGFHVRDARGRRYNIKFDPDAYPELASGAEVVATKLYYASGYNTPENYIVRFRPEILQVGPDSRILDSRGIERQMTQEELQEIVSKIPRLPDGRVRAMASIFLSGKRKGPFRYHGLRKDDPNDWIPHEHRRDLRGLRVISSWLHNDDMRPENTFDTYIAEGGRSFIRHYLIDFGAALGSYSISPNLDRSGYESYFDVSQVMKSLISLGWYQPPWRHRQIIVHKSIGYIDNEIFEPEDWKPNYPLGAFENMTVADAYWGAKIVMSFSDEQIRAAVETGEYSDPAAADYLARILIERRDIIGRYWFTRAGGLEKFRIMASPAWPPVLQFDDLVVRHGFANPSQRIYRFRIIQGGRKTLWRALRMGASPAVALVGLAENGGDSVVELQVEDESNGAWSPKVAIHIAPDGSRFQILGWVRDED